MDKNQRDEEKRNFLTFFSKQDYQFDFNEEVIESCIDKVDFAY